MATVRPIRTEEDYEAALARVSELMKAVSGPEGEVEDPNHPAVIELDVLVDLIELYEARHYPIDPPTAIGAIEYEMDQRGMTPRDLIPIIGSRSKVSEILSGKREITMPMARALHQHLDIPAEILLRDPDPPSDALLSDDMDVQRFPLREMAKRGWIPDVPPSEMKYYAQELIERLIQRAGGQDIALAPLYRKNAHRRINAKTDRYALTAWCLQTLALASERHTAFYEPGSITSGLLRQVARLSSSQNGPRLAGEFLAEWGIPLVILSHLPKTHLDGAALRATDRRPVIGLTLRYDRIDNFWFCLLHELAHIGLHMDDGCDIFTDDHSLRFGSNALLDSKEYQADELAEEALIPNSAWKQSSVRRNPNAMTVIDLAQDLSIHPAIVAGRVRHERNNYRLLSQFVGTGQVRKQFENVTPGTR